MGLRSLGLAGLGVSLGWVCEPMNVQREVSSYKPHNPSTHIQSNLSTMNEPSEMKPNLVDQTCELLK